MAAVVLLTSALLAGCGGGGDKPATAVHTPAPSPTTSATDDSGIPKNIKLERPKARSTISPSATLSAVPGAGELTAPPDARTIQGFPVPKGSKVKDPGAIEETWQFDIHTTDPADVLDFYKRVLPQMGYTVRTDVTYTVGYEAVHWDLVFDGTVSGSMAADPDDQTVFVVVNPPGQPAFAGDDQG
jgi:hypothetical protein